MEQDLKWKRYYERNCFEQELNYQFLEEAYMFGRRVEKQRIKKIVKELKLKSLETNILNKLLTKL